MKLRGLLLAAFVLAAPVAAAPPEDVPPGGAPPGGVPPVAAAERATLDEVIREEGVATAPPSPGLGSYLQDMGIAVFVLILFFLAGLSPQAGSLFQMVTVVGAQVVLIVALAILVWLVVRAVLHRIGRRDPGRSPVRTLETAVDDQEHGRSRDEWAARLREHLAAGDVARACEALWWWLARSLFRGAVEPSWTSRELLHNANRRDLAAPVGRLDRLIYGAPAPAGDDVRELWGELREALPERGEGGPR